MILAFVYVAALVAANILVWVFGPDSSPFIAFGLIGLDLSLRDRLHDRWGIVNCMGLVLLAAAVSFAISPAAGRIAAASFLAFFISGMADTLAYEALRRRSPLVRMNGSNVAGALVDSIIFPTVAFGGFDPAIVATMFAAKLVGGAVWAWLLRPRAVPA